MRRLDVMLAAKLLASRVAVAKRELADPLKVKSDPKDPALLVEASLLPADPAAAHFLHFHVDRVKGDQKFLFGHLSFSKKPETPAPARTRRWHREGKTVEWATAALNKVFSTDKFPIFVEAHVVVDKWERRIPVIAPPLEVDGAVLENSGAEFHVTNRTPIGLQSIRWTQRKRTGRTEAWLTYGVEWPLAADPWHDEEKRCRDYLNRLM